MSIPSPAFFRDRRLLALAVLGFASGLPFPLTFSMLSAWLFEAGINIKSVAAMTMVGLPYTIKFLWAPLKDHMELGWLTKKFGRRRGWLFLVQALLIFSLFMLAKSDPMTHLGWMAFWAFTVTLLSASQDIVIDAYRVDIVPQEMAGIASSMATLGYRIGVLLSTAGVLYMAEFIAWADVYRIMAAIMILPFICLFILPEPENPAMPKATSVKGWIEKAVIVPLKDLLLHKDAIWLLVLVICFRLPDFLLGAMANPFYLAMGFSKIEIANISKIFGFVMTILGAFAAGIILSKWRWRFSTCLILFTVLNSLSNLLYVLLAYKGHDPLYLTIAIIGENIASALSTTAFLAYLASLCKREFSATHYAVLSSLAMLSRPLFGWVAGPLVESYNWDGFFAISAVLGIPALLLLVVLRRRGSII
ncbi:MAG: MFS transporter [Dongiaceae bacterium]